jgi:geranylgeranyl diphosphate synthase type II
MMALKQEMKEKCALIERALQKAIPEQQDFPPVIYEAMRYSLLAGGKRLRPMMLLAACEAVGGDQKEALPFACALEMIHTYSLIHDDLPAMDNDDYRRGKLTNHKVYGEAMAILSGDALLTDAFAVAATAQLPEPADMAFAIATLSECAGSLGMVGGQVLDIQAEQRQCTEEDILAIQSRKTGALINAACVLGTIAGGGNEECIEAAAKFAAALGLAFQIRDDMLDVIGTVEEMGKGVGTDADKNTFVRLYGLDKCRELVDHHTNIAVQSLEKFDDSNFMRALALNLTSRIS